MTVRFHASCLQTAAGLLADNAAIPLLDAATNDQAQLINRLDLEATPGSVQVTPRSQCRPFFLNPSANSPPNDRLTTEGPVKGLRRKNSSVASPRPYAQSCSKITGAQLGQGIAPWSTLNASISPSKPSSSTMRVNFEDNMSTVRTHRRTLTPAPAADPSPVFKALRPATTCLPISKTAVGASSGVSPFVINPAVGFDLRLWSFQLRVPRKSRYLPSIQDGPGLCSPKVVILVPHAALDGSSLPLPPEVRRNLGFAGTMGGSVGSIAEQDYDGSDLDSDIPNELQVLLSNSDQEGEDTISFDHQPAHPPLPSPGLPPEMPLSVLENPSSKSSYLSSARPWSMRMSTMPTSKRPGHYRRMTPRGLSTSLASCKNSTNLVHPIIAVSLSSSRTRSVHLPKLTSSTTLGTYLPFLNFHRFRMVCPGRARARSTP